MRSCFTNRLLLAVNWILPASQPFEMIIPFVSLSAFWRHGGLIIVILLFHPFPVCLCVCLCVALLREWRRQYAGGWIAWFLQQESSTRQVAYRFSFMFVQSFKNAVAVSLLHWPLRTTHTHTHTRVKAQTFRALHSKSSGSVTWYFILLHLSRYART